MRRRRLNGGLVLCAVVLLLVGASGCAHKTDWVEGTLVTIDVTGTWRGRVTAGFPGRDIAWDMEMTLTQRGAKVTGHGRIRAQAFDIEGTVRGDVLSFNETSGRLRAEARVSGDEMSGEGRTNLGAISAGQQYPLRFMLTR